MRYKKCKVCGADFRQYNSLQKYCSPQCMQTGGKLKRIARVSKKKQDSDREYIKNRLELIAENIKRNNTLLCEHCGMTAKKPPVYKEECHHIVFRSERPQHNSMHDKRNLIILCCDCHKAFHDDKELRNHLLIHRGLKELFNI